MYVLQLEEDHNADIKYRPRFILLSKSRVAAFEIKRQHDVGRSEHNGQNNRKYLCIRESEITCQTGGGFRFKRLTVGVEFFRGMTSERI
jgi:hypothetical protein